MRAISTNCESENLRRSTQCRSARGTYLRNLRFRLRRQRDRRTRSPASAALPAAPPRPRSAATSPIRPPPPVPEPRRAASSRSAPARPSPARRQSPPFACGLIVSWSSVPHNSASTGTTYVVIPANSGPFLSTIHTNTIVEMPLPTTPNSNKIQRSRSGVTVAPRRRRNVPATPSAAATTAAAPAPARPRQAASSSAAPPARAATST